MQLKEILAEIFLKKFSAIPEKQRPKALGMLIGSGEMDMRRAAGLTGESGRNQEKSFQFTLKILDLCDELEIDARGPSAQELKRKAPEGVIKRVQLDGTRTSRDDSRGKGEAKTKDSSAIQKGRIEGNKRVKNN